MRRGSTHRSLCSLDVVQLFLQSLTHPHFLLEASGEYRVATFRLLILLFGEVGEELHLGLVEFGGLRGSHRKFSE
jgi:hypothetical protein